MAARQLTEIPLYPEDRACPAPGAPRLFAIFSGLARQHLLDVRGRHVQTFSPELSDLQRLVLDLLAIPARQHQ